MNLIKLLLLSSLFTTLATATVYEDAEDGTTDGWVVYDNKPAGATITNIDKVDAYDRFKYPKSSSIIYLKGAGRQNSYQLGARKGEKAWNNQSEKVIHWTMLTTEKYKIYVYAKTTKGYRKFYFSHSDRDKGLKKGKRTSYIHVGLGKNSMNGLWKNYIFDLEALLKKVEPNNKIESINGFRVTGSMYLDDISLGKTVTDIYPKDRFSMQNGKYFFAYTHSNNQRGQILKLYTFDAQSQRLINSEIIDGSISHNYSVKRVENSDILVFNDYQLGAIFYYVNKKGKLVQLFLEDTPGKLGNHVEFQKASINGTILSVETMVYGDLGKLVEKYDIRKLLKTKASSFNLSLLK